MRAKRWPGRIVVNVRAGGWRQGAEAASAHITKGANRLAQDNNTTREWDGCYPNVRVYWKKGGPVSGDFRPGQMNHRITGEFKMSANHEINCMKHGKHSR